MAIIQPGAAFKNLCRANPVPGNNSKRAKAATVSPHQRPVCHRRPADIRIPNLGLVRMRERCLQNFSATISRTADQWFASITVDTQDHNHLPPAENQGTVGGFGRVRKRCNAVDRGKSDVEQSRTKPCFPACNGCPAACHARSKAVPTAIRRNKNWQNFTHK